MPECKTSVVSNQWVKQMVFTHKGDFIPPHIHKFDHNTLLAVGEFEVEVDGLTYEYSAPAVLVILKNKLHKISCVSDTGLAFCLHILRDGEETDDIIDPADLPLVGGKLKQGL